MHVRQCKPIVYALALLATSCGQIGEVAPITVGPASAPETATSTTATGGTGSTATSGGTTMTSTTMTGGIGTPTTTTTADSTTTTTTSDPATTTTTTAPTTTTTSGMSCPDTYSSYIGGVFNGSCSGCHASWAGTLSGIKNRPGVRDEIASKAMPPGSGLDEPIYSRVLAWIDCGMP